MHFLYFFLSSLFFSDTCIGCGETLTNRTGQLNYSRISSKNHSQNCSWRISLSEGQRILLKFNHINFESTQCQHSNLTLYHHGGGTDGGLPITFCHKNPPPQSLKIRSHSVTLTIHGPSVKNLIHITYKGAYYIKLQYSIDRDWKK